MQALILAAGIGNRLSAAAGDKPKSLLEFDGLTLLERHVRSLSATGVSTITVITGYRNELLEDELDRLTGIGPDLLTIVNEDYREGSVVSLWTGCDVLAYGEPVLLMDADVLYSPAIIERLAQSRHENCFLLDREFEPGDEPVKICLKDNRIVEFRKIPDPDLDFDTQGESVGFFRFSAEGCRLIRDRTKSYITAHRRDEPYEEVLRDVVQSRPDLFGIEDITGLPWIEIDFPDDIARAEQDILPRITTGT